MLWKKITYTANKRSRCTGMVSIVHTDKIKFELRCEEDKQLASNYMGKSFPAENARPKVYLPV